MKGQAKVVDQHREPSFETDDNDGRRAVAGKGNVAASRYAHCPMPDIGAGSRQPMYAASLSGAVIQRKANGTMSPPTATTSEPTALSVVGEAGNTSQAEWVVQSMGAAFGEDFSSVKVHEDSSASAVGALAYTRGENIHFAPGQLQPESQAGRELIGHELTHVVQQRRGKVVASRAKRGAAINDEDVFEEEADRAGAAAARGQSVSLTASSARAGLSNGAALQRSGDGSEEETGLSLRFAVKPDASSGIDWTGIIDNPLWNVGRSALEVGRLIPVLGGVSGFTADFIEGAQNMSLAWQADNKLLMAAVTARQMLVMGNNAFGHILYLSELLQDTAIMSVVGAEAVVVTAPVNEALAGVKLGLQMSQTVTDLMILAGSGVGIAVTSDETELEAWKSTAASFAGNSIVDGIGLVTGLVDVISAGVLNGEGVKTWLGSLYGGVKLGVFAMSQMRGLCESWVSIWLGYDIDGVRKLVDKPQQQKSDEEPSAAEAAPTILGELDLMDVVHQKGSEFIGEGGESISTALEELRDFQLAALEGNPLEHLQESLVDGLDQVVGRLGALEESHHLATTAEAEIVTILASLDTAEAAIGRIEMPVLAVPSHTELGDNMVANALERGIDTGAAIGNAGLAQIQAKLQAAIDTVKASVVTELRPQREHVELFAQFLVSFKALVAEEIAMVKNAIAKLRNAIAKAKVPMDLVDALADEIAEMLGFEGGIDIAKLEREWIDVGGTLSKVRELASALV